MEGKNVGTPLSFGNTVAKGTSSFRGSNGLGSSLLGEWAIKHPLTNPPSPEAAFFDPRSEQNFEQNPKKGDIFGTFGGGIYLDDDVLMLLHIMMVMMSLAKNKWIQREERCNEISEAAYQFFIWLNEEKSPLLNYSLMKFCLIHQKCLFKNWELGI